MSYNSNNTNQVICQCGKQDRLATVLPQSSNSRMMKAVQQSGCCGCMTASSFSGGQNYCLENQFSLPSGCFCCQRTQHCCICEFSRKMGAMSQGNAFCSCSCFPAQQYSSLCQCGGFSGVVQNSNSVAPLQTQIADMVVHTGHGANMNNGNGVESTSQNVPSPGAVVVSTNLNSIPIQGGGQQQIITPSELNLKNTPINPEMINIALSGQTPESLSISIDSRGVVTLGVNNHPAPASNTSAPALPPPSNSNDDSRNRIRNALGDRH